MGRGVPGNRVCPLALVLLLLALQPPASADKKSFLVIFEKLPASPAALLATLTNDSKILYSFKQAHGIAVNIDESFVEPLQQLPGVLAVMPESLYEPHTTHSWEFLGLATNGRPNAAWQSTRFGDGIIIGNVDSGVWPESQSFNDDGLGDIPPLWRGACDNRADPSFRCNRKLIGAKVFNEGVLASGAQVSQADAFSPRDYTGHGTHTLSTAGGAFVQGVGVYGRRQGTAAGGSPRARVAAYKACFAGNAGCPSMDILAAMDDAVADGVNVLSLSIGKRDGPSDYLVDTIAIGAFYAVQNGVTVVASAGNSGPQPGTVDNVAPWMLTVAASTMDRVFPADFTFGASTVSGQSLTYSTQPVGQRYPIISGRDANAANQPNANSYYCLRESLDAAKVRGKIVVCSVANSSNAEKGLVVSQAGGVGMVLCDAESRGNTTSAAAYVLPVSQLSNSQCVQVFSYLRSTNNPSGFIVARDIIQGEGVLAPQMAGFSSRGPNAITPQILKPDITAPGVNVIAAYSEAVSPALDGRTVPYYVQSGTSMSCPHVAGIAGLLKTTYPSWSPAMIKSAIMTTAYTVANDGYPIRDERGAVATPLSYGAGHADPVRALDPGLVYDATPTDYFNFICSQRRNQAPPPMFDVAGRRYRCTQGVYGRPEDLNYPSITVPCLSGSTTVKRRVKNVGAAPTTYRVSGTAPAGVRVTVVPNTLTFQSIGEEQEFTVSMDFVDPQRGGGNYVFGTITWSDARHQVRSPIAVKAC